MIEELLPPSVRVGETYLDRLDVELYPQESAVIERAVEKRRREFATVRGCARDALRALGVEPAPILPGPRGEPTWPRGVVGSMTHCTGYRGAVVARSTELGSIGIDAEVDEPLPSGVIDTVSLREERGRLADLDGCGVCADRLLFCVKEAVYKAWFPLTHRFLEFHEACVTLDRDGTFSAEVRLDEPGEVGWPNSFTGRWLARNGLLLSASSVTARVS